LTSGTAGKRATDATENVFLSSVETKAMKLFSSSRQTVNQCFLSLANQFKNRARTFLAIVFFAFSFSRMRGVCMTECRLKI
jgi:hypothetical protein